jgi:hypothetical protein
MTSQRAREILVKLVESDDPDDLYEFIEANIIDSIVPCICANGDCDGTDELEPDLREGYCGVCESHSLISCIELLIEGALD